MTNNLKLWNSHADIPPSETKPITGKAYKGTSPKPHYIMYCLTDMFGPVGVGFGWDVVAEEFLPIGDEVLHWCRIKFWHTDRANTFDSYGQTKALMKTRNGLMLDEDAPKKSLTDAIVKAASQVGVAANIFLGRWDDSRYVANLEKQEREDSKPKADPLDEMDAFAKDRDAAIEAIGKQATMIHLKNYWDKLNEDRKDLAADALVINAKEHRKGELSRETPAGPDEGDQVSAAG
jgi:hypothetical protein